MSMRSDGRDELTDVIGSIEKFALQSVKETKLNPDEMSEVLAFLAKVSQVLEQAFQDVLAILIDIKYLQPRDLLSPKITKLRRSIDLVMSRSHYRDAEEICSRLGHLRNIYQENIDGLFEPPVRYGWDSLLNLIDEREGRIIFLIQNVMREVQGQLASADEHTLPAITRLAAQQAEELTAQLTELRSFINKILGLSGKHGLLEMIREGGPRAPIVREISVLIQEGGVNMSKSYNVGQGILVAEHATVDSITQHQTWNTTDIDLPKLAAELNALRLQMKAQGSEPEHDIATGQIAVSEAAAKKGDSAGAFAALKAAGKWALDVAQQISVPVATAALKTALGA